MTTSHRFIVNGGSGQEGAYIGGAVDRVNTRTISNYRIQVLPSGTPGTDPGSDHIEMAKGHPTVHVGATGTATSHHETVKGQPHQDAIESGTPGVTIVYGNSVQPAATVIEVGSSIGGIIVQPGAIIVGRIFHPDPNHPGAFLPGFIRAPKTPGDASVWEDRLIYEYRTVAGQWLPVPEPT